MPLLVRTSEKDLKHQQGLNAQQRAENIKGRFAALPEAKSKRILLLDDVLTTGATVNECTDMLMAAGAKEVRVLTATRAVELDDIYI